jgi:hypothetical protein
MLRDMEPTALLLAALLAAPDLVKGEVALSAPPCPTLIVRTDLGFDVVRTTADWIFHEGSYVAGHLNSRGSDTILVEAEGRVPVDVEAVGLTLVRARAEFDKSCWQDQLSPPPRQPEAALSKGATGSVPLPLSYEMR